MKGGWQLSLLGLAVTVSSGLVMGLRNMHYGIEVGWDKADIPKKHLHMTIAFYGNFPENQFAVHHGARTICQAAHKITEGSMRANGKHDATSNPRGSSCIYKGSIEKVIEGARKALDVMTGSKAKISTWMSEPHVEVGLNYRDKCPPTWDFDFSHLYSGGLGIERKLYSCAELMSGGGSKGVHSGAKDSQQDFLVRNGQNNSPDQESAPAASPPANGTSLWRNYWILIPGGTAFFILGVCGIVYVMDTRRVRPDTAAF